MNPGAYTNRGYKESHELLGYKSAEVARDRGKLATGGSADMHLRYDRETLVRESQAFDRDNGLYEGVINRAVDNIIGDGFSLQVRTANPKLNEKIENDFREHCKDSEVRGLGTSYDDERMVLRHLFVDGDIGVNLSNVGQTQLIESEQIGCSRTSYFDRRIIEGVEVNKPGRPLAFWVSPYDQYGYVQKNAAERHKAENFIFLANRKRASQTRGVPVMASNFPMFHRINDVCDSEAIAWQLLARFAITISRDGGPALGHAESKEDPKFQEEAQTPSRITEFGNAIIFHAKKGEKLGGVDRNLPGANFPASITMFIRLLGLPIGFPLELILLDWSKTNYSSARAALEQAFRMFSTWQRRLKTIYHTRHYTWKLQHWIDEGRYPKRSDIFNHEWITPSFPWIDQLKEAEAWGERIDRGMATLSEACKSLNRDREELLKQRTREIQDAIDTANALNAKNPAAKVDWRIFAGLKTADLNVYEGVKKPAKTEDKKEGTDEQTSDDAKA